MEIGEKKKSRGEWELKKREAFSFDVLSYHSTIGGMGGRTTFFSVTSSTGLIMVISGTVDEGLFAWLWLQSLICWSLLPWAGWADEIKLFATTISHTQNQICFGWVKAYDFIDLWFPWVIASDWLVATFFPTFVSLIFQLFLVIDISSVERPKRVCEIVCTERKT